MHHIVSDKCQNRPTYSDRELIHTSIIHPGQNLSKQEAERKI